MKQKGVAAILAFFFGFLGTHRYYLGQRFVGALYFIFFLSGLLITIEEGMPVIMLLPIFLSIVDAIVFAAMPVDEFDERYNKKTRKTPVVKPVFQPDPNDAKYEALKEEGIRLYREHQYAQALDIFLDILEIKGLNPAILFNVACCYSRLQEERLAFHYLELAVRSGFKDMVRIQQHPALAFIRDKPGYTDFVRNGYRLSEQIKPTVTEEPEEILQLRSLFNKGILTAEEFEQQKEKMLRG
jgi:tetratricopeptide (TPR) repeat protein